MPSSILITGAAGELGSAIIPELLQAELSEFAEPASRSIAQQEEKNSRLLRFASERKDIQLICLDIKAKPADFRDQRVTWIEGSVGDENLLSNLFQTYHFSQIFHFAALLSATAEAKPELAEAINVKASEDLLQRAGRQEAGSSPCVFFFPSSIAVHNLQGNRAKIVSENECLDAITLYGRQKLRIERYGLAQRNCDFRCIRYPGLISAETVPTGGTSDYAPLIVHHFARGEPYRCFVEPETKLSFAAMPDAIRATLRIAEASANTLPQRVFNLHGFTTSPREIIEVCERYFERTGLITYDPIEAKQRIVDSWPARVEDAPLRNALQFEPQFDAITTFTKYLIPKLQADSISEGK